MKLIKTFFIGATALTLSACSMGGGAGGASGTKCSEEQFLEEAAKVENHQYTKATAKYSIVEKDSSDSSGNVNEKGTLTFTYKDGYWQPDSGQKVSDAAEDYEVYIGMRVTSALSYLPSSSEYNVKYYKNPLGVSYNYSYSVKESGVSSSQKASGSMEFDKYGYLVKGSTSYESSTKVSAAGVSASYSSSSKAEVTISYQ